MTIEELNWSFSLWYNLRIKFCYVPHENECEQSITYYIGFFFQLIVVKHLSLFLIFPIPIPDKGWKLT